MKKNMKKEKDNKIINYDGDKYSFSEGYVSNSNLRFEFLFVEEELYDHSDDIMSLCPECHPLFIQYLNRYSQLKIKGSEVNLFISILIDEDKVRYEFCIVSKIMKYEDITKHLLSIINE
jgi:hypothetical protein